MFKDAAKGLCKQQSQDSTSENVTVNTTTKLEQVTASSFLKHLVMLRSGRCKLNEAKDHSFPSPPSSDVICAAEPCLHHHSLQPARPRKEFPLRRLKSCLLPAPVAGQRLWRSGGSELFEFRSWFTTGEGQL